MTERDTYIEKKKTRIDRWIAELAILDARAREAGEEQRIIFEVQMKEFSDELKQMKKVLEDLENAGEDSWHELRGEAETRWNSLQESYKETLTGTDST